MNKASYGNKVKHELNTGSEHWKQTNFKIKFHKTKQVNL